MKKTEYILTTKSASLQLKYSPEGWDEAYVMWGRHQDYIGLMKSFSVPLAFPLDGAEILRRYFYKFGVEADVGIEIKSYDKVEMEYVSWFTGEIDFANGFKDHKFFVDVNIKEGGLSALVAANEEIVYEIDLVTNTDITWKLFDRSSPTPQGYGDDIIGITLYTLAYQLIDKVTEGGLSSGIYGFSSTFLESITAKPIITTGSAIGRNPSMIKTSLKDFFVSVNAIKDIGMGIERIDGIDTIIIEEREYFFTEDIITTIPDVVDFSLTPAKDFLHNTVRVGFRDSSPESYMIGNLDMASLEPNTQAVYKLPLNSVDTELDLTAAYSASYSAILDRYDNGGEDDDIFFIWLSAGWNYMMRGYSRFSGNPSSVYFGNTGMTPRRLLDIHQNVLFSTCDLRNDDISFVSSEGNNRILVTEENENGPIGEVAEASSLTPASSPKLFKPYYFNFKAPSDMGLMSMMETSGKGQIEFTFEGNTYTGYVMSVQASPVNSKIMQFKLLSTTSNDLTKLIR